MWLLSFLDSTYERSIWWNDVASTALVVSLVIGVISTFIIVRTSSTKEDFLRRDLAKAQGGAANAELRSAEANQRAGAAHERAIKLEHETEKLRTQNLTLESSLEKERSTRLEMEKSLAPRILVMRSDDKGVWNFAPLTKFKGMNVTIRFLPDAEAMRATNDLVNTLNAAGWKIIEAKPDPIMWAAFFDGVIVQTSLAGTNNESIGAAKTLLDFLHKNGWVSRSHAADNKIPAMTLKISIGFKPSEYFEPEAIKRSLKK